MPPSQETGSRHSERESVHSVKRETIVAKNESDEQGSLAQKAGSDEPRDGDSQSLPRPKWEEDLISNADQGAVWTLLTTLDFSHIKNLRSVSSHHQLGLAASRMLRRVPNLRRLILRGDQTLSLTDLAQLLRLRSLTLSLNLHWPTSYLAEIFKSARLLHLRLDLRGGGRGGTGVGGGETPEVWRSFADAMPHLKNLKSLSLAARGLMSQNILGLIAQVCCDLESLCLLAGQRSSCESLLPLLQSLETSSKNCEHLFFTAYYYC